MKRFKAIDQFQVNFEQDIFTKPAIVIAKHFRSNEIKAMLMVEYHPTLQLLQHLERLIDEFAELELYEYAEVIYQFLKKHS